MPSARFSVSGPGKYYGGLMCWRGPWSDSPVGGTTGLNLVGPNMSGYFYGMTMAPSVPFTVTGTAAPGAFAGP